jgi:hypothetical protein
VPHAILVDPENPPGTITAQRLGWPLDGARGNQVVRLSIVINILVKGYDPHAFMHHDILTEFSHAGFSVRQTQQLLEKSVEIGTNANWRWLVHGAIMIAVVIRRLHSEPHLVLRQTTDIKQADTQILYLGKLSLIFGCTTLSMAFTRL